MSESDVPHVGPPWPWHTKVRPGPGVESAGAAAPGSRGRRAGPSVAKGAPSVRVPEEEE